MRITNPETLWLFLIIIPILILMVLFYFSGIKGLQNLTGTWRFVTIKRVYRIRTLLSSLLFILTLICLLLGLIGISWQKQPEKDDSVGLEIVFVLDVSRSMNAEDIKPSRLEKSILLINGILDNIGGVMTGIISFKGDAVVSVPVTEDRLAINGFLSSVNSSIITTPGSNQERAVRLALDSFSGNSLSKRIVLLISDGEALQGDLFSVVKESLNRDIPLYTVAAGTAQGSLIPQGDGFIKNISGKDVVSRTDYHFLKEVSELTYGKSYRLEEGTAIPQVVQDIQALVHDKEAEKIRYINVVQYRFFLLMALLFLLLFIFFKEWRWSEIL